MFDGVHLALLFLFFFFFKSVRKRVCSWLLPCWLEVTLHLSFFLEFNFIFLKRKKIAIKIYNNMAIVWCFLKREKQFRILPLSHSINIPEVYWLMSKRVFKIAKGWGETILIEERKWRNIEKQAIKKYWRKEGVGRDSIRVESDN